MDQNLTDRQSGCHSGRKSDQSEQHAFICEHRNYFAPAKSDMSEHAKFLDPRPDLRGKCCSHADHTDQYCHGFETIGDSETAIEQSQGDISDSGSVRNLGIAPRGAPRDARVRRCADRGLARSPFPTTARATGLPASTMRRAGAPANSRDPGEHRRDDRNSALLRRETLRWPRQEEARPGRVGPPDGSRPNDSDPS